MPCSHSQERAIHPVSVRPHIINRSVARHGDVHWFSRLDPAKAALVIVNMQNTFCQPGAPGVVLTRLAPQTQGQAQSAPTRAAA